MKKTWKICPKWVMFWGLAVCFGCHWPQTRFSPSATNGTPKEPTGTLHLPTTNIQPNMLERIQQLSAKYLDWTIEHRRRLHQYPELSGTEQRTQLYLQTQLDSLGIPYQLNVGIQYSIVAEIKGRALGSEPLPCILLRADMDALPIQELNEVPYKSLVAGISHQCGHDGHSANLLGVARILNELRDSLEANFVLVWQPHEEKLPGGAAPMIAAGLLEGVDACIGLHLDPMLHTGTIGLKPGPYMASIDELEVTCTGKGAHGGSSVHLSKDPILSMAYLLTTLEQVKAHNCPATTAMALSFGQIQGGHTFNVIPDVCTAKGTFRSLSDQWRVQAHQRMMEIAEGVGKSTGTHIDFRITKGHPVLVNDKKITETAQLAATEAIGATNVIALDFWMASEDFSHFCQSRPSVFIRLGVRNEAKGTVHGLHTAHFDMDEDAFLTGTTVMAWAAISAARLF